MEPYFDQTFCVGFSVGGFDLGLHPEGEPGPGGVSAYWGTNDIASEVAQCIAIGAACIESVNDVGDGIMVATIADPFGNSIGLIQNPHFDVNAVT